MAAVTVATLIVALAALPAPRPVPRPWIVAISGVLVVTAVIIGLVDNLVLNRRIDPPTPPTTTPNAAPPPATTTVQAQGFISLPLGTDSPIQATLYFGQLDRIMTVLQDRVSFNTDTSFRRAHPTLCASTVVLTGVPEGTGEVFAEQLGAGWGGAENVPDNRVVGPDGILHQQLIVPPTSAINGQSWTGSAALMQADTVVTRSGNYSVTLIDATNTSQIWSVAPDGRVTCSPS